MKIRALAVLLPMLALSACTADNNVSIQIFQICAPPEDSCTFSAECDLQFIGINAMDLSVTETYWSFIEVHNQLLVNDDATAGRPNTHDAYVEEYTVEYEVSDGTALPTVTRRVTSGPSVVPAEGTAVVSVLPIPPEIGAQLAAGTRVVANVRLRGFLADQGTWETAAFPIPVEICSGCIGVPTCADPLVLPSFCPQPGQSPTSVICDAPAAP